MKTRNEKCKMGMQSEHANEIDTDAAAGTRLLPLMLSDGSATRAAVNSEAAVAVSVSILFSFNFAFSFFIAHFSFSFFISILISHLVLPQMSINLLVGEGEG